VRTLDDLIRAIREPSFGIACALITGEDQEVALSKGADPLSRAATFEIGSITKTFTGTLLACMADAGEVALDDPVSRFLDAGPAGAITLEQLATHTSGLPRLAPNALEGADPSNPYAHYDRAMLLAGLHACAPTPGPDEYSNFGFQVLGEVLSVAGGAPLSDLVMRRVIQPLSIDATYGGRDATHRLPGYAADEPVSHWDLPLAGPGGIEATIDGLAAWVASNLHPERTNLEGSLRLAQQLREVGDGAKRGLGWNFTGGGWWKNGGTGGFHSLCAFVPERDLGLALLTNHSDGDTTGAGVAFLTALTRS
jgi:CubicO group peptidase (beta-lactamase class C family)